MAMTPAAIDVVVAYAGPEGDVLENVTVAEGAPLADAVRASGIVERLRLFEAALGYAIFGERASAATPLRAGDRVELLRPLVADPKEARRQRASARPLPRHRPVKRRRR
jgi:uncharacterized protein